MEKIIIKTGKNGTHEGVISVELGYKTKTITVNNHSTHDDEQKAIKQHRILVTVDNSLWHTSDALDSEETVLKEVDKIEKELTKHLTFIADNIPVKTFKERMADKGFN